MSETLIKTRTKPAPPPPKFKGGRRRVDERDRTRPDWPSVLQAAGYPTHVLVLDFETYFDDQYSMRGDKLSTVEYITDGRFEALGVAVLDSEKPDDPRFYRGQHMVETYLGCITKKYGPRLGDVVVAAQNATFDAGVLAYRYGIYPRYLIDTLGLARHWDARNKNDLASIAERLNLPVQKGDTKRFKGWTTCTRRLVPKSRKKGPTLPLMQPKITDDQWPVLEEYALADVRIEFEQFKHYLPRMSNPSTELRAMQHTLELFTKPCLRADEAKAEELKQAMEDEIDKAVAAVGRNITRADLSGENSFEALLKDALVEAGSDPVSYSKPTKKPNKPWIFAIAKDDPARESLENHRDETVRKLMAARSAVKSWPLHIARINRIIRQAQAAGGKVPVPLKYHGAHCLPGDAEVLTPEGWRRLDLWGGGQIMQWSPDGGLDFNTAENHRFVNDEPMVEIDSPYIKTSMTKGHTVARYNSTKSFDPCGAGVLLDRSISYLPIAGEYAGLGDITPEQMRVLVAVQADGHWQTNPAYGRELRFGLTKPQKQARLRHLLGDAGVPYREAVYPSKPGEITFRVRYTDCPEWLTPDRKVFGPWVLDSTPDAREAAILELRGWDGGQYGSGNQEYYSSATPNHEWVAVLCHLTGRGARRSGDTTIIRQTRDPRRAIVAREHVRETPARPVVYCPSTTTGYWMVRHRGTIHITGNTGRWSGAEKINLQNLGSRGHDLVNAVRELLIADEGQELVIADASQIEARVLAWVAGQWDLVDKFANGEEIYCGFAAKVLGVPVRKPRPGGIPEIEARHKWARNSVGKVGVLGCVAEGTPVLTQRGWVAVERVTFRDKVWDGVAWVSHSGVEYQGEKTCIERAGVWLTEDHEIYGKGGWCPAACQSTDNLLLATPLGNSRWRQWSTDHEVGLSVSNAAAPAVEYLSRTATTWSPENLHAAIRVLKLRLHGRTLTGLNARNLTAADFLIAFVRLWPVAILDPTRVMADAASESTLRGSKTEQHFYDICVHLMGGTTLFWKSTASTMTETMNPETSGSPPAVRTCRTWDIILAGSNRRYQAGPLLVANCGYGMGPDKTVSFSKGALDFPTAKKLVETYREENNQIVQFWADIERAFLYTAKYKQPCEMPRGLRFETADDCDVLIVLPNGRELTYHNVKTEEGTYGGECLAVYNALTRQWGHVWGGHLTENVVQAISRDILWDAIWRLEQDGHHVALHVHDELVAAVPKGAGEAVLRLAIQYLSTRPEWGQDLPLAAEGVVTDRYGGH